VSNIESLTCQTSGLPIFELVKEVLITNPQFSYEKSTQTSHRRNPSEAKQKGITFWGKMREETIIIQDEERPYW